ncbi:serine carboxypeptidase-like 7 [Papaver somniferum]|uniref:serine carboxypeptidase-like 7 n=1 Tax=Papaver somniferum TaxID=3469 RepID=UPI000E700DC2|nr:serine carboxypeptidase-like 7 [Papaver somniferum]
MVRYLNHVDFNVFYLSLLLLIQSKSVTSSNDTISTGLLSSSFSSRSTVKYLPGFSGPLPFYLETGYIGVSDEDSPTNNNDGAEDIELFYYFVKSERKPEEDPLLFWFTGGPRCSSLSGLFFEIGPLNMDIDGFDGGLPKLVVNNDSWTKVANIIFPDAPVYTGFSYSKSSPNLYVGDKKSSQSIYEFIIKWLIGHPEFKSNPLYIGGDSYSGIIVPMVVQCLINDIETRKYPFLQLKGYLLGNPVTDKQLETNAKVPYAYGMGLLSYELYESMKENCKGKYLNFNLDNVNCTKDRQKFQECLENINLAHVSEEKYCGQFRPVDNRRSLSAVVGEVFTSPEPELPTPGCRSENQNLVSGYWANDDRVQEALHVKKETVKKWIRCNFTVPYKVDILSSVEYHQNINTRFGYRSLIYSGDHDFLVPHVSTEAWIRSLNISIIEDWRPWLLDDQFAGYTTTYSSGLTYATVKGAGHTAPEYRPKESYAMFERWISHAPL